MSKYEPLWNYIQESGNDIVILSFEDIQKILSIPVDHSFLNYKKELLSYGYQVDKISLKKQEIQFSKLK